VRKGAPLALLAVIAAGCGGDSPEKVLKETADNLGDVRSGRLAMRMSIAGTAPQARGGTVGFALRGPFALAAPGGIPKARVAYTQVAGPNRATVTLIATGKQAFVQVGGRAYELSAAQSRQLRAGTGGLGRGEAGQQLKVGSWVRDPEVTDGPPVDGQETQRVTGKLDVPAAARDLLRLTQALGPGEEAQRALRGGAARELEGAVRSSRFELLTGKDDHLLRRLRLAAELRAGDAPGARISFDLGLARPNEKVTVAAPRDPQPASALPRG
jgi:hypothetical protein